MRRLSSIKIVMKINWVEITRNKNKNITEGRT